MIPISFSFFFPSPSPLSFASALLTRYCGLNSRFLDPIMKLTIFGALAIVGFTAAVNHLVDNMLEESLLDTRNVTLNSTLDSNENTTQSVMSNSFPTYNFMASMENNTFAFYLNNKKGIIFKATMDEMFKQAAWYGGHDIKMTLNATDEGVAVYLTNCKNEPISLKPNVIHQDYYFQKKVMACPDGCVYIHLIATDGASQGLISFNVTQHSKWIHVHIIFGVLFGFVICKGAGLKRRSTVTM